MRRGARPESVSRLASIFCKRVTSYKVNRILAHRTPVASTHGPQPPRPDRTYNVPIRSLSGPFLILFPKIESRMMRVLSLNQ